MTDMYKIRCALAHANGMKQGMSEEKWKELKAALQRLGIKQNEQRDFMILTENYVRSAYNDVNACLRDLVARAR